MFTSKQNFGLSQRQQQTHTITPQLQQAIKLLTLSNLELSAFVNQQLAENPFLESQDTFSDSAMSAHTAGENSPLNNTSPDLNTTIDNQLVHPNNIDVDEANLDQSTTADGADGNALFSLDTPSNTDQWHTVGTENSFAMTTMGQRETDSQLDMISIVTPSPPSLHTVIANQISMTFGSHQQDTYIAHALLEELAEDGYLRINIQDFARDRGLCATQVQQVLERLQNFEPTGIFAQSLGQCFALQLQERGELSPQWQTFLHHLPLMEQGDPKRLMKRANIDENQFGTMIKRLKSLNPTPAHEYTIQDAPSVIPDVFLRKLNNGDYHIELNTATLPRVLVNQHFYNTVKSNATSKDHKTYYSHHINTANWLVKAIHQRTITITKVVTAIVKRQRDFFDRGIVYLKPMTLKNIADDIGMHESTISRVTSNKYIYCEKGVFEFKYFFSTALSAGDGDISAKSIHQQIKDILKNETIDHIYSDDELATLLQNKGINVARRTVAKYRESINIPSSSKRRKHLKLKTIIP